MSRGQIPISIAVIGALATVLASFGGAWATSASKVAVLEERENNHYAEVLKRLDTIDKNFTDILKNSQLDRENMAAIGAALGVKIKK